MRGAALRVLLVAAAVSGWPAPPGMYDDVTGDVVTVTTEYGSLSGRRRASDLRAGGQARSVDWYLGVPFARPPVGDLRFRAPVVPDKWSGIRQAVRFSKACPQPVFYEYTGYPDQSEDCLYLNIYTPSHARNGSLPVLVFFHGGSYLSGSSSIYSGQFLAQHGQVVVVANYRLGMLGFLCARAEPLMGNYGLLDQIQTLQWVRANAHAFGGDARKVTISGNSAGGASVGLLTLSLPAKGLFHRVIGQSGSPTSFWAVHNETVDLQQQVRQIARVFRCEGDDLHLITACLRRRDAKLLSQELTNVERISPSGTDLKPCIDGHVLAGMPRDLLKQGYINPVSYFTGIVQDEWTRNMGWFIQDMFKARAQDELDDRYEDGFDRRTFFSALSHVFVTRFGWSREIVDLVGHVYTNWSNVTDPYENRNQYIKFFTDMSMIAPTVQLGKNLVSRRIPVWLYLFDYFSPHTTPLWWKSFHSAELNYIFGAPFTSQNVDAGGRQNYTDTDRRVSRQMIELWTQIVSHRSGEAVFTSQRRDEWRRFSAQDTDYLHITAAGGRMRKHLRRGKVHFWNSVVPALLDALRRPPAAPPGVWTWAVPLVLGVLCVGTALLLLTVTVLYTRLRRTRAGPEPAAPQTEPGSPG